MKVPGAVVFALTLLAPAFSNPIQLVIPPGATTAPGNEQDGPNTIVVPVRLQQVYGTLPFLNAGVTGPVLISQFAFRAAPNTGPSTLSTTSVDIFASTSSFAPNTIAGNTLITDTFATNLGPDNTLVFSGPLAHSSPGCAGPSACPFDLVVAFNTPFQYDPNQGFLLLDFQFADLTGTGFGDAVSFDSPGGPLASLFGLQADATGSVELGGDITQFTFEQVVPEPASAGLLLLGLGGLAALRRRSIGNKAAKREPVR